MSSVRSSPLPSETVRVPDTRDDRVFVDGLRSRIDAAPSSRTEGAEPSAGNRATASFGQVRGSSTLGECQEHLRSPATPSTSIINEQVMPEELTIDHDWRRRDVVTVPFAGTHVLGLSRQASYDAASRGEIPTIRLGRRLVVPVVQLRRLLGEAV